MISTHPLPNGAPLQRREQEALSAGWEKAQQCVPLLILWTVIRIFLGTILKRSLRKFKFRWLNWIWWCFLPSSPGCTLVRASSLPFSCFWNTSKANTKPWHADSPKDKLPRHVKPPEGSHCEVGIFSCGIHQMSQKLYNEHSVQCLRPSALKLQENLPPDNIPRTNLSCLTFCSL